MQVPLVDDTGRILGNCLSRVYKTVNLATALGSWVAGFLVDSISLRAYAEQIASGRMDVMFGI